MKYWKGKPETVKEGEMGTMDDNGYVPNSTEILKYDYDRFVEHQLMVVHPKTDGERLIEYAKKQKWI